MGGREGRGAPSEGSRHVGNRALLRGDTDHAWSASSLASGIGEVEERWAVGWGCEVTVTIDLSPEEVVLEVVVVMTCLRMLPILSYTGSVQGQQSSTIYNNIIVHD